MSSRSEFGNKVMAAFVVAVLVVAALMASAWKISRDALDATGWVARTHEIRTSLAAVESGSLRIELATQNYRLTGDPAHLAARDAAIAAREAALRRIGELAVDPGVLALSSQLRATVDERLAISRRSVELRNTQGAEAAAAHAVSVGAALKATRERIHRLVGEIDADENRLLAERVAAQSRTDELLELASALVALALAALLVATYVLVRRQMRVTEAAQRTLEIANARVRAIFDSAGEGLHGIDMKGNIVFENPAAAAMLGWDSRELIGQPAHALMHHTRADGTAYPATECHIHATRVDGVSRHVEDEMFWRKDGTGFPVAYTSAAMRNDAGEVTGVVVSFRDITEQRTAEQALIAARNAAERANSAKDSFLATMSHEIRTPLGGLLGMLELLSLSPLNPDQGEVLQAARDSGRSLLRILNDILDWSKIEEGKLELAPRPTSIASLVAEVANTYARVASANSVILSSAADPRLSPALVVDPLRLSQVLNNFVSNAIKFSHEGGRIELRAELVEHREDAEVLRISVQDHGIGIAPEVQQRLFQSYGQASAETARMYGGTGLGLAICRRLADLMEGCIAVDSAPGRGSTFSITLTLPITQAVVEPAPGPAAIDLATTEFAPPLVAGLAAADAPRVLVVDDHPVNRKLLALQLGLLGLRAGIAENGEVALARWREGGYALVITDCHMPVLDGYALTRAIRSIEAAEARPRTPVFAWTANALAAEKENCRLAGMDELLVKPTELARLRTVLAKWLPQLAVSPAPTFATAETLVPTVTADLIRNPDGDLRGRRIESGMTIAPVDVSVLAALVGDDPATIGEFLADFRASATGIAAEISAACAAGDAAQAGALAHKLKSSARSIGALALGELCALMEKAGKAGDAAALTALLPGFQQEMVAVQSFLDSWLAAPHQAPAAPGE
jgi:PAS domain S-box-containing protein